MNNSTDPTSDNSSEIIIGNVRYPIGWNFNARTQAAAAAMRAVQDDMLVIGARTFNFASPIDVEAFFAEVGPEAVRPLDDGVHHLFWIYTDTERPESQDPVPVLIPQAFVPWFLLGVGIRDSVWTAQQYVGGPGVLPLHDPTIVHPDGWQPPTFDDDPGTDDDQGDDGEEDSA